MEALAIVIILALAAFIVADSRVPDPPGNADDDRASKIGLAQRSPGMGAFKRWDPRD